MTQDKSKGILGDVNIPIMVIITTIFIWCASLSVAAFNQNGVISGLTASVGDIKDTIAEVKGHTEEIPNMKAEIDFLAKQRGYKAPAESFSTTSTNQSTATLAQ